MRRAAAGLRDGLRAAAGRDPYRDMALDILGPAPAPVVKVNNRYRYRVTVIGRNDKILRGPVGGIYEGICPAAGAQGASYLHRLQFNGLKRGI